MRRFLLLILFVAAGSIAQTAQVPPDAGDLVVVRRDQLNALLQRVVRAEWELRDTRDRLKETRAMVGCI